MALPELPWLLGSLPTIGYNLNVVVFPAVVRKPSGNRMQNSQSLGMIVHRQVKLLESNHI